MLEFDNNTIERLKNPKTKIEDKLHLIIRHIEIKYDFQTQPNHWDNVFDSLENEEKVFYKVWLWICYAEWENLLAPISEFDEVFGVKKRNKLLTYLENESDSLDDMELYYTLDGEAGKILLNWGLEKLKTTYNSL